MEVITSVKVPDYIYALYNNSAERLGNITTEELMSRTLSQYATRVAAAIRDQIASSKV